LSAYGTKPLVTYATNMETYLYNKRKRVPSFFSSCIKPPEISPPVKDEEDEIHIMEECDMAVMYRDYTLSEAYRNKDLDRDGELHYLQKKSFWQ